MKTLTLAVILCLSSQIACIKSANLTRSQNIRLTNTKAVGVVAAANLEATKLALKLSAAHLISDDLTRQTVRYTAAIAGAIRPIVILQRTNTTEEEKAVAALKLLSQINLPPELQTFVDSPNAAPEVAGLIALLKVTIGGVQQLLGGK